MKNDSTIACPKCGLGVPLGIATCPQDGTPLDDALIPGGFEATMKTHSHGARTGPAISDWQEPTRKRAGEAPPSVTIRRDPLIGQSLGEYVVEELVGVGGMGLVYRGLQPVIGKPVAIKILRPEISDSPSHVERLLAEARAVNAVRHRGIIDIFNFGRLPDGRQYLVMEYLQGQALDDYIFARAVLTPGEAVGFLQEIADALQAAHEAGVVHRDLKPNNIFLVSQSGGHYVKLLDFGLAKQAAPHATVQQTNSGLVVGTPEYMAPEQARGEAVGPKTDLYSLGVLAFQMLTGRLPFDASSPMEFLVRHLEYAPPKVIELMPDIPEELSELVDQLLAKAPADRPSSADQVRRELRRISRLLPQDTTYVGPVQAPAQLPPPKKSGSVIVSPSINGRRSGERPAPAAAVVQPSTQHPDTLEVTHVDPGGEPGSDPGGRRKLVLGGAIGGAAVLIAAGIAVVSIMRAPPLEVALQGLTVPEPSPQPEPVAAAPAPIAAPVVTPDPAPAPAPVVAAPPAPVTVASTRPPAGPRVVRPKAPDPRAELLRRISYLGGQLDTRAKFPAMAQKARDLLARAKSETDQATTEDDRKRVATNLDTWERTFLQPK